MMKEEQVIVNKMGTVEMKRLVLTMSLPMILSMVMQAFYNIVDSYFVSQIQDTGNIIGFGEYGITALAIAYPVQLLMISIGVGSGIGVNALLSRSLGQDDKERASHIAGNAIFLGLCTFAVFFLFGIFGVNPYLSTQTSDPIVTEMARQYLRICTMISFGSILFMIYEKLIQGTGKTVHSMIAQLAGAITNIILDPIMIFGLFGVPAMGIRGAAYATVIGQIMSLVLGIFFHHFRNKDLFTSPKYIRPKVEIIKGIYKIGIPAIIMQSLVSIMTYFVNIIFGRVSQELVTAYGLYYKIQSFVFFAAFGVNNAVIPIVGFNYGKWDKKRVHDGIKYAMIYTLIIMLAGAVAFQIFAAQLIGLFNMSADTAKLAVTAMRICSLGYLFVGANVIFQGVFQALGNGTKSLLISLLRFIIVPLPVAILFGYFSNAENIIWSAFPIGEACALVVGLLLFRYVNKKTISQLG